MCINILVIKLLELAEIFIFYNPVFDSVLEDRHIMQHPHIKYDIMCDHVRYQSSLNLLCFKIYIIKENSNFCREYDIYYIS